MFRILFEKGPKDRVDGHELFQDGTTSCRRNRQRVASCTVGSCVEFMVRL